MQYKTLTITNDHIKLLQAIKFETFSFDGDNRNGRIGWGIDQFGPWGGNYPIEDIALILGHFGDYIPGTENDVQGKLYYPKLQEKFLSLYEDITQNFEYMFSLLIFMSDKGGLTEGTYRCNPRIKEWEKID